MEKNFFVMASCGFSSSLFGPFTQEEAVEVRDCFIRDPRQEKMALYVIFDLAKVQDPQSTLSHWRQESETWPSSEVPPMRVGRDYCHCEVSVSREEAQIDARRSY